MNTEFIHLDVPREVVLRFVYTHQATPIIMILNKIIIDNLLSLKILGFSTNINAINNYHVIAMLKIQ